MTTFPTNVTITRLLEFRATIEAICQQQVGRVPSWGKPDDAMGEIMELQAMRGWTGPQLAAWLYSSDEAAHYRMRQQLRMLS